MPQKRHTRASALTVSAQLGLSFRPTINPILVVALSRSVSGKPSERRILLGSIAYAVPYVAMWTLVGLAVGDAIRAAS